MGELRLRTAMTREDFKSLVAKIIQDCKVLGQKYVENWEPVNPEWETVRGAAYLRLSTDQQVSVEKGSLEQQIYIAISEAVSRSKTEKVNFRIVRFHIEPGITGRHDNRPEFIRLQNGIQDGKYRFVIFKELARIARETDIWKRFFKLCIEKECDLFIRGFPFNPNDPSQIFQLDIMAAFAEYESNQTSKRLKENIFSAMVHSGKFNTTHQFLGLDPLAVNGETKVGLYTINETEMEQVVWIMNEFLLCRSYERLLERCEKRGVCNKKREAFTTATLKNLLTNTRYTGRWVINRKKKDKNQDKLMPYDRYMEVDLPHGQAVDRKLWDAVQQAVVAVAGNKTVDKAARRIYPLSSLLRAEDGSTFWGSGAWSSITGLKHLYYWNKEKRIRLGAESLEDQTRTVVNSIVENSGPMQEALARRIETNNEALATLTSQREQVESRIKEIEKDREKLNRRLDFLLDGSDEEAARQFRGEYRSKTSSINSEIAELKVTTEYIDERTTKIHESSREHANHVELASQAQKKAKEMDSVALRGLYTRLFDSIIVGDADGAGFRKVEFVLRDPLSLTGYRVEDADCECLKVVGPIGIEPTTSTMSR